MTVAQETLPPEPASASRARRFTVRVLRRWDETDQEDVVALLVSELVTNAVLHAGSDVEIVVRRRARCVRVEISDESPVIPAHRDYDDDATTGRGLELLDVMADAWGVERRGETAKVVWFEIATAHPLGDVEDTDEAPAPVVDVPPDELAVRLLSAPVQLFPAMQEHTDALLREYALIALEHRSDSAVGLPHLPLDMTAVAAQIQAAIESGRTTVDLVVATRAADRQAVVGAREALHDADTLAQEGRLLSPPALPEVAACRGWFLGQIVEQIDGAEPTPWRADLPTSALRVDEQLDHRFVLDHLLEPVVVADDTNHITYANRATEKLLGWGEGELVGQRLTTLIPERLHEAHVAGYTHYLVTRRARLLGKPVRVPARRRDGSEVEVELVLRALSPPGGRQSFVALLRPAADLPVRTESDGRWLELVERVVAVRAEVGAMTAPQAAGALLESMVTTLGWQLGAWWHVDGDELVCVRVWADDPDRFARFADLTRGRRFAPGDGLPGSTWESGKPTWITDVVRDANFPRLSIALAHDLRCACALPLRSGGEVMGVVELMTTTQQDPSDEALSALDILGRVLPLRRR